MSGANGVRREPDDVWSWLAATFVYETGVLPHVADLVLNTQFSHYFIAGMALCLIYRNGPGVQSLLILVIALGNAIPRAVGFADRVSVRYGTLYLIHAHIGFIIFERLGPHVNAALLVVATMALMVGGAAALHYGIEKPLAPQLKRALQRVLPAA